MRYSVAELASEETQLAIADRLKALNDADVIKVVVFTWWAGEEKLTSHIVPAHLPYDIIPLVAGATHVTIEEVDIL